MLRQEVTRYRRNILVSDVRYSCRSCRHSLESRATSRVAQHATPHQHHRNAVKSPMAQQQRLPTSSVSPNLRLKTAKSVTRLTSFPAFERAPNPLSKTNTCVTRRITLRKPSQHAPRLDQSEQVTSHVCAANDVGRPVLGRGIASSFTAWILRVE